MHAQLMGPAGLRKELHVGREFFKPFRHAVFRDRCLRPGRAPGKFFPVLGIPSDGDVDHPLSLFRDAPDQGLVDPVYGMPLELVDQSRMGSILFGDDHDTRGVLVQPVHHPRPFLAADGGKRPGPGFEMVQQGIDQGARPIAGSRMDHHAGLFIQDQQCVIFIENFKGNGLGLNVERFRPGDPEHDDVAGPDFVTGLGGLPVNGDVAVEDQSPENGSGEIRITVGQEMVEALRAFARRNDNLRPRVNVRHGRIRDEPVTRALVSCGARPLFGAGALFPDSPGPLRLPTGARRAQDVLRL